MFAGLLSKITELRFHQFLPCVGFFVLNLARENKHNQPEQCEPLLPVPEPRHLDSPRCFAASNFSPQSIAFVIRSHILAFNRRTTIASRTAAIAAQVTKPIVNDSTFMLSPL